MAGIKRVEDLVVYRNSLSYLKDIYTISYSIPHLKHRTQINNSTEAIPPLIAEGFAKQRNPRESSRFYEMAMAESDETVAHLRKAIILSARFPRINATLCNDLIEKYQILLKQLNRLATIWRKFGD